MIAIFSNSKALFADAAHSASDVISSIVVLVGVRTASLPPDRDHPYGHGKAESIAAIVVAVILFIVGIEIAVDSFKGLLESAEAPGAAALYMAAASIFIKEGLFRYKIKIGRKQRSRALIIDAWHHRSDALSSLAAVVGIGLAIMGGKTDQLWLINADAFAGILIAILIMRMAWMHGKEAVHTTMDHVLHPEDTVDLRDKAANVNGVEAVNAFYAREHGYYVIVDICIRVDKALSVEQACIISDEVRNQLLQDERVKDVFVILNS